MEKGAACTPTVVPAGVLTVLDFESASGSATQMLRNVATWHKQYEALDAMYERFDSKKDQEERAKLKEKAAVYKRALDLKDTRTLCLRS